LPIAYDLRGRASLLAAVIGASGAWPIPKTGERHLDQLQWGLLPYFTKDPAHARRPIDGTS
jgi:hypothetical protein